MKRSVTSFASHYTLLLREREIAMKLEDSEEWSFKVRKLPLESYFFDAAIALYLDHFISHNNLWRFETKFKTAH